MRQWVTGVVVPAPPDIKSEVWLPVAGWNGKLPVAGSGGSGGARRRAVNAE
jgi:hypothetical protein